MIVDGERVILCKKCRFFKPNGHTKCDDLIYDFLTPIKMGNCMNPDSRFYRGLKNELNGCTEKELQNCEVSK